jgi:transglutaminase-like putative cysteine protease
MTEKSRDSPEWLKERYPFYDDDKRQGQYTSTGDLDDDGVNNINDKDSDGDGLSDGFEVSHGLDPSDPEDNIDDLPQGYNYINYKTSPGGKLVNFPNYVYGNGLSNGLDGFSFDSVLFEVEPAGNPRYWRLGVFDDYRGSWESSYYKQSYDGEELDFNVEGYYEFEKYSYTIDLMNKWTGNIPTALHTDRVYGFEPKIESVKVNDAGVFSVGDYIDSYSFNCTNYYFDHADLSAAKIPESIQNIYLVKQSNIPEDILDLGKSIAIGESSPFEKAYAISKYLVENYVYDINSYDNNLEVYKATSEKSSNRITYQDILETMLFKTGTGTCMDFATAFVFMCRANNIPSRFVTGFTPGEIVNNKRVVKSGHMHAWGEILLDPVEWIGFEVTPSVYVYGNTSGVGNSGEDMNIVKVDNITGDYFGGTGGGTASLSYLGLQNIINNRYIDSDFDGTTNNNDPDDDNDGISDHDELANCTNPLDPDTDNDGISDYDEINIHGTSPTNSDTDNDGLTDYFELEHSKTDPLDADTDGGGAKDGIEYVSGGDPLDSLDDLNYLDSDFDGLTDGEELEIGTDPEKYDTDDGGVSDFFEFHLGYDPLDPSDDLFILDSDHDGLSDQKEIEIGTERFNADSDFGGADDGIEFYYLFDPLNASDDYLLMDNDGDGLINLHERIYGTNENLSDTDHGEVPDGVEIMEGFDPLNQTDDYLIDSDGDGLYDYYEYMCGTDPYNSDTDYDGLSDQYEMNYYYDSESYSHLNPTRIDTDGDSLPDGFEIEIGTDPTSKDSDGDGLDDNEEIYWHSSPLNQDTDNDGLSDSNEVNAMKTSPILKDTDGDGIDDNLEYLYNTNPLSPDSDGDGVSDYLEDNKYGTSPTNPQDRPDNYNERIDPEPYNNPDAGNYNNDPTDSSLNNGPDTSTPSGGGGGGGGDGTDFSMVLLAIGLILIIVVTFYYLSWRKRHIDEITDVVEVVEKELTELKDDFDDDDVRQAIFKAYKAMLKVMEKYDFTRKRSMTPREFESVIRSALPIDDKYIVMLTNIFEEARYSNHLMSNNFKSDAIESFRSIKIQLQSYNTGDTI